MSAESDDVLKASMHLLGTDIYSGTGRFSKSVTVVSAKPGEVVFKFRVQDIHHNSSGYMHGGVLATLVDLFTGIAADALVKDMKGTSLELNGKYLHAINRGETVLVRAEAIRSGKRFVVCRVDIMDVNGKVMAQGGQTIYLIDPQRFRPYTHQKVEMKPNNASKL